MIKRYEILIVLALVSCNHGGSSKSPEGFYGMGCSNVEEGRIKNPSKELEVFVHKQLNEKIENDSIVSIKFSACHPVKSENCELLKDEYNIIAKVQLKGSIEFWDVFAIRSKKGHLLTRGTVKRN